MHPPAHERTATRPANTRTFSPASSLPDGNVWGRPVGVAQAPDGSLFVSDDGSQLHLARQLRRALGFDRLVLVSSPCPILSSFFGERVGKHEPQNANSHGTKLDVVLPWLRSKDVPAKWLFHQLRTTIPSQKLRKRKSLALASTFSRIAGSGSMRAISIAPIIVEKIEKNARSLSAVRTPGIKGSIRSL